MTEPRKEPEYLTEADIERLAEASETSRGILAQALARIPREELQAQHSAALHLVRDAAASLGGISETVRQLPETKALLGRDFAKEFLATHAALDGVMAGSTGTAAELRSTIIDRHTTADLFPLKWGEEYALERLEQQIVQLARVAAATADNTKALAEISKANLDQVATLVGAIRGLHATTQTGMESNDRLQRFALALAVIVTIPHVAEFWRWTEPARAWVAAGVLQLFAR